jgi:hypothetical protein
MKYSTIQICPRFKPAKKQNKWRVHWEDSDVSRENGKNIPYSLGFMHYHTHLGKEWAFKKLKQKMISDRVKEIETLTKDIEYIHNLKINDW